MEIEGQDGSRTQLKEGSEVVFGRGKGFDPNDLTVSRRHISFELTSTSDHCNSQAAPRVSFEVIGKNPIWVCNKDRGEIRAFRKFERGELGVGDSFCVTSKDPIWFSLKKVEENERGIGEEETKRDRELGESLDLETSSGLIGNGQDLDLGFESIDVSNIDPVKEFGFLVIGHEFDNYPKRMIHDVKSWNWFLGDPREDSTEDEDDSSDDKGKKTLRRKRKKKAEGEEDDEEWTGESEDEEALTKAKKLQRPKYNTRSKDLVRGRPNKDTGGRKGSAKKRSKQEDKEEDEEEEEGDETLGGFIVDDVEEESEVGLEDEDEEEEFEEDEDDYEE